MARTPSDSENFSAASLCYGDPDISDFTCDVFFFRVPLIPTDLSDERCTQGQRNYIKWFRLTSIINYRGERRKNEREIASVADQELRKSPAQETEAVEKEITIGEARKSTRRRESGSVHQEHAAEERETDRKVAVKEERESTPVADQEPRESPTQENEAVEKKSSVGESVQENTAEERETDRKVATKEERESVPVANQELQKSLTPAMEAAENENETIAGEEQKSTGEGETTVQEDVQEERETDQKGTANEKRENKIIPAIDLQDPSEFPSLRKYERITKKEKRGEFQRLRGQSKP
ncbi:hypothetical protein OROGR_013859 [Orobanche gracilis]